MLRTSVACHTSTKMLVVLALLVAEAAGQSCKMSQYIPFRSGTRTIVSPMYPAKYPPSVNCYYYYYTDPGYRLSVDCYDVDMGPVPWECSDSLKFVGSTEADNVDFCSPVNVQSADHRMVLVLTSTPRSEGGRFVCSIRPMRKEPCDCGWSSPKRIVGGKDAGVNEFPFMVSIINALIRQNYCGGSIISSRYVLTAAHCLQLLEVRYTGLLVGEHDMSTGAESNATRLHRADKFIIHPSYNPQTTWNDIGLVRSATTFTFSMRVGPICLPFNRPNMPEVGDSVTAMGWGTTFYGGPTSDVLQKVQLRVVPIMNCVVSFNQSAASGKQVCTYMPGKDTCQMDSGGPLAVHDDRTARLFLGAIVSFGADCAGTDPAVNTRVGSYVDWIQMATNENFCVK